MNGKPRTFGTALAFCRGMLIAVALVLACPARGADPVWSLKKLPGSDNLADRMAGYYEPVNVTFEALAPDYDLPLDLQKLTNADFAKKLQIFGNKELLRQFEQKLGMNGFAAFVGGPREDITDFYKQLKVRGLPIFVTSDSLLHLYHIQFDETLRDIEEREFFNDALLISKAIRAEALKLHTETDGDLKEAARLLVGYGTVPAALLGQADLGADAAKALQEVSSWPDQPEWKQAAAFKKKYSELLASVAAKENEDVDSLVSQPAKLKTVLGRYLKANPPDSPHETEIPKFVEKDVRSELELIAAHRGFSKSPLFSYQEDYSQYVPRGHYTRSKKLKQYFKALMWYGRMTFLLRGRTPEVDGLIPQAEARVQTLAASVLAGMMEVKLSDGRTLAQAWDRLYAVTAYYVGLADDLTPYEYRSALRNAIGRSVSGTALTDAKRFFELRKHLARMRTPEIYSGLGAAAGPPAAIADESDLAKALALTQGMRLMGQRYIPDSYMMGRLVYPTVGTFNGTGNPFTLVQSQGGPIRGFPRGLDVMAVLGSDRAGYWTRKLGDGRYKGYGETLEELEKKFEAVDTGGWNRNMYWSWLYALKALLTEYDCGYPTFMRTTAWRDKQLSAALASWSQLRHDTILYAKQSYTMMTTSARPQPKMVEGYVEPVPEFYARLLALTRMTLKGLSDFGVLNERATERLEALESIITRLLAISKQELSSEKLTADDYAFIRSFGESLEQAVAGLKEGTETTIVADVHTDGNTSQVLEEGTGYLHPMVVVYPMPDGGLVAGVGPVLSHYEFKHPMSDRLTDEAWREMLRSGKTPPLPEWAESFTVSESK